MLRWLKLLLIMLLGFGGLSASGWAAGPEVTVVLTSNSGPYKEALGGFQKAFGAPISVFALSDGVPTIPSGTRIIVAIGGKAALTHYPSWPLLIYCLAPGTQVKPEEHPGRRLNIHSDPSVYLSVAKFKELQPSLKRIALIWAGDSIQDIIDQTNDIARRLNVEIVSNRVRNSGDLPDVLRSLKGKVDALWLPADAMIVSPQNVATMKEFSLANGIPFYVPSAVMVAQGATASVSTTFADIGALTAQMTQKAMHGTLDTDHVFPENIHVAINSTSSKICNLKISDELLKQADKVIP